MTDHSNEVSRTNRKKKRKRRWPRVLLLIFLVIGGFFAYAYYEVRQTTKNIYSDLLDTQTTHASRESEQVSLKNKKPFSILLMGIDTGDQGRVDEGRSDTLMVMTVNPNKKETTLLSIPRDTRTEIVGRDYQDKINHAYAFGGPAMSINTVQNLLDIPIDYYVSVNMKGIQQIVDAVGGITVTPPISFTQGSYTFVQGEPTKLDGAAALEYSRMRKNDPEGDYGRQLRQREIVLAVLSKTASLDSILNYQSVLATMEDNLMTNLEFNDMVTIFVNYNTALANIDQIQMQGEGIMLDGIYYAEISDSEKAEISSLLKRNLEITE